MTTPAPVAIVTGAGSGIGREVARLLGARGYRLVLAGRRPEPLRRTAALVASSEVSTRPTNMGDPAQAVALVDHAVERFGRLDALVNNAGFASMQAIAAHTPESIRRIFDTNTIGPIAAIARAWRTFECLGRGCVVNVSSYATVDPFPGLGVYAAAKAGLNLIAQACANEGRSCGIRAFAVAPGAVETPLLRALFSEADLPRTRTLTPEAVAAVIVACVVGERDAENGRTIVLPSP